MAEACPRASDSESVSSSDNEENWLNRPSARVGDDDDNDDDDDDDDEREEVSVVSLFDDRVFPDAPSMLAYCRDKFGFDFVAVRDRLALDFHGCVRLVNFGELAPRPPGPVCLGRPGE
jgi:protein arginine N-methyltransferase 3